MDKASQVLARGPEPGVPRSFRAIADHSGVPRSTLHHRARGRRSIQSKAISQQYLAPSEEKAVVEFILQMADLGTPVRIKYIPAIAFSATRHRSEADRPVKAPGPNWAKALETRNPELKARRVKALDWNRHERNIYEKVEHWFEETEKVLEDPAILPENVYNMDETGVMLSVLGSVKVLVGKDDTRDYRGARVKRTMVTAIECISADGSYLEPLVIWPATTHRSNWTTFSTPGWHYACSESGYTDSWISLEWLTRVFDPQTCERANGKPRVLICDGFGTHETLEILEHCFANNIKLCRLPSHTSHKLQPCDIAVFAPLKVAYRDNVERMERGGVNTIGKQHFTSLYSPARAAAFTRRNILAGWSKGGLYPFNPQRVLKDLKKPSTAQIDIIGQTIAPRPQDSNVPVPTTPLTPVTPITAEAFTSLHDMIIKQDAHALEDAKKRSLERRLAKLTKAAQMSIVRNVLQQERIQFLLRINNEAKPRRLTKSIVLGKGKGKVMSFEDLEAARTKRAEVEASKCAKKARGRKRRGGAQETNAQGTEKETPRMNGTPVPANLSIQVIGTGSMERSIAPCPGRAPVARMW